MKEDYISVKEALNLISANEYMPHYKVRFKNEKVKVNDAIMLGKSGIEVPEDIIEYDDKATDFSDISKITDEDILEGKIKWAINANIPLDKEIADWIRKENINVNEFAAKLIRSFYENIKSLPNNAAM